MPFLAILAIRYFNERKQKAGVANVYNLGIPSPDKLKFHNGADLKYKWYCFEFRTVLASKFSSIQK